LAPEIAVLMVLKVVLSCVPTAVMAAMITTEMSAAMSPYSMAGRAAFILEEGREEAALLAREI
jgi:hypothetical protein